MFPIHEPVDEWMITLTEITPANGPDSPDCIFNTHNFKTIAELRTHLQRNYSVAKFLQYDLPYPGPEKVANLIGRITFMYNDRYRRQTFEFDSARDFAAFLDYYPVLAAVVGYQPKAGGSTDQQ
jgi:hypothetical protein